jgi:hypothetical protein
MTFEITTDWRKQAVILFFLLNSSLLTTHHVADAWSPPAASRRFASLTAISSSPLSSDEPVKPVAVVIPAEDEKKEKKKKEESSVVAPENNVSMAMREVEAAALRVIEAENYIKLTTEANAKNYLIHFGRDDSRLKRSAEDNERTLSTARLELEAAATRLAATSPLPLSPDKPVKPATRSATISLPPDKPVKSATRLDTISPLPLSPVKPVKLATRLDAIYPLPLSPDEPAKPVAGVVPAKEEKKKEEKKEDSRVVAPNKNLSMATTDEPVKPVAGVVPSKKKEGESRVVAPVNNLSMAMIEVEAAGNVIIVANKYIKLSTEVNAKKLFVDDDTMKRSISRVNARNLLTARLELEASATRLTNIISSLPLYYDEPLEPVAVVVPAKEKKKEEKKTAAVVVPAKEEKKDGKKEEKKEKEESSVVSAENNPSMAMLEVEATGNLVIVAENYIKLTTEASAKNWFANVADDDETKPFTAVNAKNLLTVRLELEAAATGLTDMISSFPLYDDEPVEPVAVVVPEEEEKEEEAYNVSKNDVSIAMREVDAAETRVIEAQNYITLTAEANARNYLVNLGRDDSRMKRATVDNEKSLSTAKLELEAAATLLASVPLPFYFGEPLVVCLEDEEEECSVVFDENNLSMLMLEVEAAANRVIEAENYVKLTTEANARNYKENFGKDDSRMKLSIAENARTLSTARLELEAAATRLATIAIGEVEAAEKRVMDAENEIKLTTAANANNWLKDFARADSKIKRSAEENARALSTARLDLKAATIRLAAISPLPLSPDKRVKPVAVVARSEEKELRVEKKQEEVRVMKKQEEKKELRVEKKQEEVRVMKKQEEKKELRVEKKQEEVRVKVVSDENKLAMAMREVDEAETRVIDAANYIKLTTEANAKNYLVNMGKDDSTMKRAAADNDRALSTAMLEMKAARTRLAAISPLPVSPDKRVKPAAKKPVAVVARSEEKEEEKKFKFVSDKKKLAMAMREVEVAADKVTDAENYIKLTTEANAKNYLVNMGKDDSRMKQAAADNERTLLTARIELKAATTRFAAISPLPLPSDEPVKPVAVVVPAEKKEEKESRVVSDENNLSMAMREVEEAANRVVEAEDYIKLTTEANAKNYLVNMGKDDSRMKLAAADNEKTLSTARLELEKAATRLAAISPNDDSRVASKDNMKGAGNAWKEPDGNYNAWKTPSVPYTFTGSQAGPLDGNGEDLEATDEDSTSTVTAGLQAVVLLALTTPLWGLLIV